MTSVGDPEFGASRHVANIILTVMKFHPDTCSAMNIRYSREQVALLKKNGFRVGHFDRRREPKRVKDGGRIFLGMGRGRGAENVQGGA